MKKAAKRLFVPVVLVVMSLMFVACRKEHIRVGDYISIEAEGYDGFAKGEVLVDTDKLKKDLLSKKILGDKEAKVFLEGLRVSLRDDNHISKEAVVDIEVDEQFKDNRNIDCSSVKIKVEGLDSVKEIDVFATVNVQLEGISPKVRAIVTNESDDEYASKLSLKFDDRLYKVGDELKVVLEKDKDDAGREGYLFKETEKTYVIGNISAYPENELAIDNDSLVKIYNLCADTIKAESVDNTKHIIWRLTGDNSHLLLASTNTSCEVALESVYYLNEKQIDEDREENFLYIICKATLNNNNVEVIGYFAFEFKDIYIDKNGECVISTNSMEKRYISGMNYEALYNDLVTGKSEEYKVSKLDIFVN